MQDNGWGIPPANVQDPQRRDTLEAGMILDTLEEEVIPLYYDGRSGGFSPQWVARAKRAMMTVIPRFNMRRVFHDYSEGLYRPAAGHYAQLAAEGFAGASRLADWKQRVRGAWSRVGLQLIADAPQQLERGRRLQLRVAASLNGLAPADVRVELLARRVLPESELGPPALCSFGPAERDGLWRVALEPTGESGPEGTIVYALDALPPECGQFATEVRIYPRHELLTHEYELGLMKWL